MGKLTNNKNKSPLASSSVPPFTIQEQPDENDEAIQSSSLRALADRSPQQNKRPSVISNKH